MPALRRQAELAQTACGNNYDVDENDSRTAPLVAVHGYVDVCGTWSDHYLCDAGRVNKVPVLNVNTGNDYMPPMVYIVWHTCQQVKRWLALFRGRYRGRCINDHSYLPCWSHRGC